MLKPPMKLRSPQIWVARHSKKGDRQSVCVGAAPFDVDLVCHWRARSKVTAHGGPAAALNDFGQGREQVMLSGALLIFWMSPRDGRIARRPDLTAQLDDFSRRKDHVELVNCPYGLRLGSIAPSGQEKRELAGRRARHLVTQQNSRDHED